MRPCHPTGTMPLSPRRVVAIVFVSAAVTLGWQVPGVSGFSAMRRMPSSPAAGGVAHNNAQVPTRAAFVHPQPDRIRPTECPFLRRMAGLEVGGSATTALAASSALDQADPATVAEHPNDLAAMTRKILSSFTSLDDLYVRSSSIRCPFWRRRAADAIDGAAMILRFLIIRHKSLGIFDPLITLDEQNEAVLESTVQPPGWKAVGHHVRKNADGTVCKNRNLDVATIASTIRGDWEAGPDGTKGYYITGRLNSTVYRDDCLFDGPDPDMPVRGLRKYLGAASHLFDSMSSHARLLSLEYDGGSGAGESGNGLIVARWMLDGTLMLPWRPEVKPWTGTTRYHLDGDGLVYLHEESWDISVLEAFVCTVWPDVGERIWGRPPP